MIIGFILAGIAIMDDFSFKVTPIFFFIIAIYLFISLFKYIDRINRDLKRFLTSIKYSDFTQSFLHKNFGAVYSDLYKSIGSTYDEISSYRIRAEENLQYLKTLIEQVPSGIISYKESGEVELINKAAKRLLNVKNLTNINLIKEDKHNFKHLLENVEIGKEKTIKFYSGAKEKNISVFTSNFKLGNQLYTLITLKDLESELEKERLENEMNIAQNVQVSLLPKEIPIHENYEFSVLFKPAKRVGGDFYDFFRLGTNKLGIIIGDVSGKGLGAAIYTTLIKGIFQTLAFESSSTSEVLTKANSLLFQMLDKKSFITAIYAVIDTDKNTLTFSRAGHEPLLIYEGVKNQFLNYRQKGLGLGLDKGKILGDNLEEYSLDFKENDFVLFYTDGLTDLKIMTNENDSLGKVKNIISANHNADSRSILKELEFDINNFTEVNEQYDDITMIMVKRKN